jgi:hypothetical protein
VDEKDIVLLKSAWATLLKGSMGLAWRDPRTKKLLGVTDIVSDYCTPEAGWEGDCVVFDDLRIALEFLNVKDFFCLVPVK